MTIHDEVNPIGCGCDRNVPAEGLLAIEEAMAIAWSLAAPSGDTEQVGLGNACGRVAAIDIAAPRPMPAYDQSAMDGFAVRRVDMRGPGPWRLRVTKTVAAGDHVCHCRDEVGVARIYTGAPVPDGSDAVVMLEDCHDEGAYVTIGRFPGQGENIRLAGSDTARGERLIGAQTRIEPRHVGLLAANGISHVQVLRRPRVGIFSTGSELILGAAPEEGRVFDANRPMLVELAKACGAEVTDLGIIDDDPDVTARFFMDLPVHFDLLVSSGAVSAGGRDYIRPAFVRAGGDIRGWRVALKPGKPVLFGQIGQCGYFGLPGNPLSAFVCFELFVSGQIRRLSGFSDVCPVGKTAVSGFSVHRKKGRTEYVPARIVDRSPEGMPVVETLGNGSSGTLLALAKADGLAVLPPDSTLVSPGDLLGFMDFKATPASAMSGDHL